MDSPIRKESVKTNLHLFFSPFRNESRALREANSLVASGCVDRVVFACYQQGSDPEVQEWGAGIDVWRAPLRRWPFLPGRVERVIQWVEWTLRVAFHYVRERPVVVHAHSLAALPAGVVLKLLGRSALIYDAHELESERNGWGSLLKGCARALERTLLSRVDYTIVVSDSIRDWYLRNYDLEKVATVRNLPVAPGSPLCGNTKLRETTGIPADHLLFLYPRNHRARSWDTNSH